MECLSFKEVLNAFPLNFTSKIYDTKPGNAPFVDNPLESSHSFDVHMKIRESTLMIKDSNGGLTIDLR